MSGLRIALPPLAHLTEVTELAFLRLDRAGQIIESGRSTLSVLGANKKTRAVECYLHPLDSISTRLDLPPLSGSRLHAAVICAAQALLLGPVDEMHIAHSTRDAQGRVHLGWLAKSALHQLIDVLDRMRLSLRGLYPASFGLPVPLAGQVSACVLDEHWLLRYSVDQAVVQPCSDDSAEERNGNSLDGRLVFGHEVCRLDDNGPDASALSLSGAAPGWSLHAGLIRSTRQMPNWTPAVACCALAVVVWALGLNLYAAREAAQGRALKAGMSQRVKQAFPELPVILNPLQQARQQLAARTQAAGSDSGQRFNHLLQHAAEGMPFMAGSVQNLTYHEGRLQLQMLAETPLVPLDAAWQETLKQAGVSVNREDRLWTLSPLAESAVSDTEGAQGDKNE